MNKLIFAYVLLAAVVSHADPRIVWRMDDGTLAYFTGTNSSTNAISTGGSGGVNISTNYYGTAATTNVGINLQAGSNTSVRYDGGTARVDVVGYVVKYPFRASYTNTGYVWTNATYQSVPFQSEDIDEGNCFDSPTATYEPPTVGMILIGCRATFGTAGADTTFASAIYKNGTLYDYMLNQFMANSLSVFGVGTCFVWNNSPTNKWKFYFREIGTVSGTTSIRVWGEIHY